METDEKTYEKEHGLKAYATKPETNPFAEKIICGHCNKAYIRKTWKSGSETRKIWQCQERYKVKGVEGCSNRSIDEDTIKSVCESAFNTILKEKSKYKKKWEILAEFGDSLEQYNAMRFSETIFIKEHLDFSMNLMLIESLQVRNDGLIVQLKDKNKITIKIDSKIVSKKAEIY